MSNNAYVKEIADELNQIAWGNLYYCPCCGEQRCHHIEDDSEPICPDCEEEMEQLSMWDHLNDMDIYDLEYRVESKHADCIKSVRIMVACGGPNVFIDTASRTVDLYWWTDEAHADISSEASDLIEEFYNELWICE